jgi:hypothetical protein
LSPGPPVSSTNKTDRHDITKVLLKVALNTIKPNQPSRIYTITQVVVNTIRSLEDWFLLPCAKHLHYRIISLRRGDGCWNRFRNDLFGIWVFLPGWI